MYVIHSVRDTVGVEPSKMKEDARGSILATLRERYEGLIDKDLGVIICIDNVRDLGPGMVAPMSGAAFYDTTFDITAYKPELNELVEGEVSEITEFGAFVRVGPLEGLLHVSQVMDEFISFDPKGPSLVGKESGRMLKAGDSVRARIVTASIRGSVSDTKIALTMRQPFLGKPEWVEAGITAGGERPKKEKKVDKRDRNDQRGGPR